MNGIVHKLLLSYRLVVLDDDCGGCLVWLALVDKGQQDNGPRRYVDFERVHAVVPAVVGREELGGVIEALVAAEVVVVRVEHNLVPYHRFD